MIAWIAEIENSGAVQVIGEVEVVRRISMVLVLKLRYRTSMKRFRMRFNCKYSTRDVAAASFAMAGSDRETERMEIQKWALRRFIRRPFR